jgi:predicted transcriptional regulator
MESIIQEHEDERKKSSRKDVARDVVDALLNIYEDKSSEVKITRANISKNRKFLGD